MTFSQIITLISDAIGNFYYASNGVPQPSLSSGLLKGLTYTVALITPSSTNFSPLIFFCLVIAFVGFGIGLIKRIIKL